MIEDGGIRGETVTEGSSGLNLRPVLSDFTCRLLCLCILTLTTQCPAARRQSFEASQKQTNKQPESSKVASEGRVRGLEMMV